MPEEQIMRPLVTVVTPCFNSAAFIEDTIRSVLGQTYQPIEYIVMDGGSTDGTVDIVRRYADRLILISEPDQGQSDAINKGWRMARGDILAWLNADDVYFPETVATAVSYLDAHPDVAWVYGRQETFDPEGRVFPFRFPVSEWDYNRLLNKAPYICQPTVFLRRQIVEEMGYLREDLYYVMDYEYWLRIGRRYPGRLVPAIRAGVKHYRETKTMSGGVKRMAELEAMRAEYGATGFLTGYRHEWVESYLREAAARLRAGEWRAAGAALRQTGRFPTAIPRGLFKALVRAAIPPAWETRLRQWILRRHRYPR